jgi:hypothetical protein
MMENVPYICQFNHTFIPYSSYGKPSPVRLNWGGEVNWISDAKGGSKRKKEKKNTKMQPWCLHTDVQSTLLQLCL